MKRTSGFTIQEGTAQGHKGRLQPDSDSASGAHHCQRLMYPISISKVLTLSVISRAVNEVNGKVRLETPDLSDSLFFKQKLFELISEREEASPYSLHKE